MELKKWIYDNHKYIYKGDLVWRTHAKGLHVIGDCSECEHQVGEHLCGDNDSENYGYERQDGCIRWEKKND